MPAVNEKECTGCESCVDACPAEAISMVDGIAHINQEECTDCGACVEECPVQAIAEK